MKTIILQILGYLIYISTHIYFLLISEKVYSIPTKIAFAILGAIIILFGVYDYQINYKKTGAFKLSPGLLIVLSIGIWVFKSSYPLVSTHLVLLVITFYRKRQ